MNLNRCSVKKFQAQWFVLFFFFFFFFFMISTWFNTTISSSMNITPRKVNKTISHSSDFFPNLSISFLSIPYDYKLLYHVYSEAIHDHHNTVVFTCIWAMSSIQAYCGWHKCKCLCYIPQITTAKEPFVVFSSTTASVFLSQIARL